MERKARSTMSKKFKKENVDLAKPLPFDKIGSEDDPCFAKFHDLTAKECQRCGDSEICAIVQAQKLHGKRKEVESKTEFRDITKTKKKVVLKKKK
jgi:hypothetical protein